MGRPLRSRTACGEEAGERERASWEKEKAELVAGLHELADQLEETEKQRIALLESNRRYEALAGDVGSFVMELHTMGQRFLETAYQRSDACLNAVEGVVGSLSSRLGEAAHRPIRRGRSWRIRGRRPVSVWTSWSRSWKNPPPKHRTRSLRMNKER